MTATAPAPIETATVLEAVRGDDATRFADLAERYRPQFQLHCYRMLGSFDGPDET